MESGGLDYKKLGLRIREARKAKGYTQERLSEMAGISPNYLSRVETFNGGVISLSALLKICNVLDVGMDYMLVDSLKMGQVDILALNALNEQDRRLVQAIVKELVEYKTNLLITLN